MSRKIKISESSSAQPRSELLQVADAVAREKGIERSEVLRAMELALEKAAKSKYGENSDIEVTISPRTGETKFIRHRKIVGDYPQDISEISLKDALKIDLSAEVGGIVSEELPPIDFGRVAAQSARTIVFQKVREAERTRQYEEFKDRIGDIITSTVKRVEFGDVFVELGHSEGILRKDGLIPRETFRVGDRVRALIANLRPEPYGPLVVLSRTHPQFMEKLFEQEVPEIYDGVIEIKSVARDPGSRSKIAVYCSDPSLDPVGACVGVRGARIQAVTNELRGEKIDVIPWSSNLPTFVVNALAPAEVSKVVLDEEMGRVEVVVSDDQLSLAIGRRGQNVSLASQLTKHSIYILSENDDSQKRSEEIEDRCAEFIQALDVDDMLAQLLVTEGFSTIEEVAYVDLEEFCAIEGFDKEIAEELQSRARYFLENKEKEMMESVRQAGVAEDLLSLEELSLNDLLALSLGGILNLDDLAGLSGEELKEILDHFSLEEANDLVMKARGRWFV